MTRRPRTGAASILAASIGIFLLANPLAAQEAPRVGTVDFYGLRAVSEARAREALGFEEGDAIPDSMGAAKARLEALPSVERAHFSGVCCEAGGVTVYVGVEEDGAAPSRYRPAPDGDARLPADVVAAGDAFEAALSAATQRGSVNEDRSQGHALMEDPAARAVQERFLAFAARDDALLREVLRTSADAAHRALAAQVLGYAADKQSVVADLADATRDADESVRNNATRALAVIATLAQLAPERGIRVPPAPFVEMLNSPVWTDRNKASLALMELSASRDSALLAALRAHALPALAEMARWKTPGHALPPFVVLGRAGGLPDDEIMAAWSRGDRESVIAAALGRGSNR